MGPKAALLSGGRLHLQHGPIDLIIGVDGDREVAFEAAKRRFDPILETLVQELPRLRSSDGQAVEGAVAGRMVHAVAPHHCRGFVTPMAAVAGSVADEVLAAICQSCAPRRAYVNNGGDIAVYLSGGDSFQIAVVGPQSEALGQVTLTQSGGIATSGAGGRSLNMGIADSVTVIAETAAKADAAATLIANAVDLPGHPAVRRVPAQSIDPDSDLGRRDVVTSVGALTPEECGVALRAGQQLAEDMFGRGLITAAGLFLRRQWVTVGQTDVIQIEGREHA